MTRKPQTFQPGDIVRHRGEFLRSIGWYTDVPINGRVLSVQPFSDRQLVEVEWSDGDVMKIINVNIELWRR